MEFLVIALLPLLSTLATAQRYEPPFNFPDEPFLPIFPVYPYSPKLMKRGAEKDVSQLNSELYPPRPDARDSYSPSFTGTYQRNNQSPYLKPDLLQPQGSTASIRQQNPSELYIPAYSQNVNQDYTRANADTNPGPNIYSPQYNTNPQAYSSVSNPFYNGYQTILIPQQIAATLYSNYNYQAPFNNYRTTGFAATVAPQQTQTAYSERPRDFVQQLGSQQGAASFSERPRDFVQQLGSQQGQASFSERPGGFAGQLGPQQIATQAAYSESPSNSILPDDKNLQKKEESSKNELFLDGSNYLGRDLDGQASISYKVPTKVSNQVENLSDLHVRNAQYPNGAYSLIHMGQSAQHYALPQDYNYPYGQLMDSFVKLMPENGDIYRNQYKVSPAGAGRTQAASNLPVIAKTGLAYVMTPAQFHVNVGPRHVKNDAGQLRAGNLNLNYGKAQKGGTSALDALDYGGENGKGAADTVNYTQSSKLFNAQKNGAKYQSNEEYGSVYPSPQAYTYQYSGYNGGQSSGQGSYKTTLDDVNFGVKGSLKNLFMS